MKIATAFIEVRLDRKAAEKDAKDTANGVLRTMTDIFKAGIFIAGIRQSIMDASNLNETLSKTRQVFGDASAEIEGFAATASQKLGLSKQATMDAASTFAVFGKAAGLAGQDLTGFSTNLVELAADFASFYNTSPEQAIYAIGAALRGESEPIRAYGVLLNDATLKQTAMEMGLYSGKGAIEQQSRVLAAQKEILNQAGDAAGDFARTSDGLANSQRIAAAEAQNARASFGEILLPVYERIVKITTSLVKIFGEMPAPIQTGIIALVGFVALSGPIKSMKELVSDMVQAFIRAGVSASTLATAAAGVGAVIGAAVLVYQVYSQRKQEAEARTRDLADALRGEASAQNEALQALAANDKEVRRFLESMKALGLSTDEVAQYMRDGTGPAKDLTDAYVNAYTVANGTYPILIELANSLNISTEEGYDAAAAARDLASEIQRLRKAELERQETQQLVTGLTGEQTAATDDLNDATAAGVKPNEELAAAVEATAKRQQEAAQEADDHRRALEELYDEIMSQIDAQHAYERAVDDADEALAKYQETIMGAKGDIETIDDAARDAADTMYDTAEAYAEASGESRNSAAGVQMMIESLFNQAAVLAPGDPLRARLLAYIAELQSIPTQIGTKLFVSVGGQLTGAELRRLMEGRARGGPVRGGQTYLVGEEGPELFVAPSGGGTIIPNGRTERLIAAAQTSPMSAPSPSDTRGAGTEAAGANVNVTFGDIVNTVDYDAAWRTTAFYLSTVGVG